MTQQTMLATTTLAACAVLVVLGRDRAHHSCACVGHPHVRRWRVAKG